MKVGIDLGTSYSLIATTSPSGQPILIPDFLERDEFQTPSVIHLGPSGTFVGALVDTLLEQQPGLKAIRYFKRWLGRTEPLHFDEGGAAWHPESVAALVLKKLRSDAESFTGTSVDGAVITVPAHFNDTQRRAVLSAAMLADLPVLGLIEEPVAAALHYGIVSEDRDRVFVVYDLGGGTFDVSAICMDEKGVYVLAKDGLTDLGGKEFDERVGGIILAQFERAFGDVPALSARSVLDLRRAAEELKIALCTSDAPRVARVVMLGERAVEIVLERAEFEQSVSELIEATIACCQRCLTQAGLRPRDVHSVLMVGGGSMVPAVRRRLERLFDGPEQRVLHHEPSRAVALGAALRAAQLGDEARPRQLPPELRGVSGHTVAVRTIDASTGRPGFDPVIKRGSPLPSRAARTYFATRSGQSRLIVEVVQYGDRAEDYVSLGELELEPLAGGAPNGGANVIVEMLDDGTVTVRAADPRGGGEIERTLVRAASDGVPNLAAQRGLVRSALLNHL